MTRNRALAHTPQQGAALAGESTVARPTLEVEISGIRFAHPVLSAPGPLGFGREVQSIVDLRTFGGFITKSVTLEPREGHAYPHIAKTEGGYLNSLGLPNLGLAGFLTRDMPFLRSIGIPIIVSVAGHTVAEYLSLVEWLNRESGIAAIELNVSCPNVEAGMIFGTDAHLTHELVSALRPASRLPLWVKLTPNVTNITLVARAAQDAGADALSVANTLTGLAIDVHTRRPKLGAVTGGLSGPAIRPIAVYLAWQVARACTIPVIGTGGITTHEDALEFFIAGARAIAVGTAMIDHPGAPDRIRAGLTDYLIRHGCSSVNDIVGSLADARNPHA